MIVGNWPMSKDELYGPPPAYSRTNNYDQPPSSSPPSYTPSIYVLPITELNYAERPSLHASILLPKRFTRYLLATGLMHMVVGLSAIIFDVMLTIMNESYSFTGLWAGVLSITLGVYLILFMTRPRRHICALQRLQFIHILMGMVLVVALVLVSINLASDSCYKIFLGPDRCQHAAYMIKIALVTLFSFTLVQLCITKTLVHVHRRKAHLLTRRTDGPLPSDVIG